MPANTNKQKQINKPKQTVSKVKQNTNSPTLKPNTSNQTHKQTDVNHIQQTKTSAKDNIKTKPAK